MQDHPSSSSAPGPELARAICRKVLSGPTFQAAPRLSRLLETCAAAYAHGEPWRQALLAHLRANARRVAAFADAAPGLRMAPVEATYLAWIDARGLGVTDPHQHFEAAGVGLSDGADFGAPGFVRLNFGCSGALLDEALRRMARAMGL